MLKKHYEHRINISASRFFRELFFNHQFNEWLFLEKLKMEEYKSLEYREDDFKIYRKVWVKPKQELPTFVRSFIKGDFGYYEEGEFDKKSEKYIVTTTPSALADKVKTNGLIYVLPDGDNACYRIADIEIEVKIPIIGGKVEEYIGEELDKSYNISALATNEWISTHNL